MAADDPHDLERFVEAQARGVYERALAEVRAGRKASHWMWFVFPQLAGLGFSPMARRYAISGLEEARGYLAHPLLGVRLREIAGAAAAHAGRGAHAVFGSPAAIKLRAARTLLAAAAAREPVFGRALDALCGGVRDPETLRRLGP